MPFGIALEFKNNYIKNPIHEIVIAAAGPIANIIMICVTFLIKPYFMYNTYNMNFFICSNIFLLVINLTPALPLDGGRILKGILLLFCDNTKAYKIVEVSTRISIIILFALGIYIMYITRINLSVILICLFLFFNLFNEKQQNTLIIMRGIIYHKEKVLSSKILKCKKLVVLSHIPAKKLLRYFHYHNYCIITVLNNNLEYIGTITETQVILSLINKGTNIKVENILDKKNS